MLSDLRSGIDILRREGVRELLIRTQDYLAWQLERLIKQARLTTFRIKTRITGRSVTHQEIAGNVMELDARKAGINQELLINGIRESASTAYYQSVLNRFNAYGDESPIVMDIGANIGYFALIAADYLEDSTVYAFEPGPDNLEQLYRNIELNDYESQIIVINKAVGSELGTAELHISGASNHHSVAASPNADSIQVDLTTVNKFISQQEVDDSTPVIIRMDVEGYEMNVFEGMTDIFSSSRPIYLFAEVHAHKTKVNNSELLDMIDTAGFNLEYVAVDNGDTPQICTSFKSLHSMESNYHIFLSKNMHI